MSFGWPVFSGPCPVGMHIVDGRGTDCSHPAAAALALCCIECKLLRLQQGGFPGQSLYSGTLLTVVSQPPRYTDHGFVADKTCYAAGLSPGNLVHEHRAQCRHDMLPHGCATSAIT